MKLLNKEGKEIDVIDFGEVFVGDSKVVEVYLLNDNGTLLRIYDVEVDSPEVKVLSFPSELAGKEKGGVRLEYKPNIKIKKGLKAKLKIKAVEVWS